MAAPILPISSTSIVNTIKPAGESASAGFRDVFTNAIQAVEGQGQQAAASVERFLSGDGEELHTAVLATQRAELSFELFLQARNKVVSAYQEIMRMQV